MTIEKTYKLYIKDNSYELTENEVNELYNACRMALNISLTPTFPYYPHGIRDYPCPGQPWSSISTTDTLSFSESDISAIDKNDNKKSIRIRSNDSSI